MWCWRRLLRVPWTARRSKQSILKEISPQYSLEGLMVKRKFQSFGDLMWRNDSVEKTLMLGKNECRRRRGWQRMRWLDGITNSMAMSLIKLQLLVRLACCSPWGCKELDTAEQLNWPELMAQQVKNPPAMQETWDRSLGWEDPLEEGKAMHSSILPWRIPWTVQSTGSQRVGHEWATFTHCHMMLYFDLQTSDCITYVDTKWLSRA